MATGLIRVEMTVAQVEGRNKAARERAAKLPGVQKDIMRRTRNVARVARATCPSRTGKLKATIRAERTTVAGVPAGQVAVGNRGTPYVGAVIFGARPHIIRARQAKMLRFEAGGRIVFAKQVNHPGNRPNPFLVRALRAAKG